MSEAIQIGRLRARYRVRGDASHAKDRLDGVLGRVLDQCLETAVAELGLPEGEEICLRTLRAPVRLSLDATNDAVAASWSLALTTALRDAIASGRDVVRFRSRRHALLDLVFSVARGDLSRSWAWAQLELWDGSVSGVAHAGQAIAGALCALPDAAPAAVAETARRGGLPALVARLSGHDWARVARASLGAFGADESAMSSCEAATVDGLAGPASAPAGAMSAQATARSARIAARSAIAAALGQAPVEPSARAALLILAALEAEPESLRRGPLARAVLAALARQAKAKFGGPAQAARGPAPETAAASRESTREAERRARSLDEAEKALVAPAAAHDSDSSQSLPVDPHPAGRTRAGGILYLLHVVAELGLPESLCAEDGPLAARSLRFDLHALALALLPIEPRDPAALAFCGLGPNDEPPSEGADKPSAVERDALEAHAAAIAERLRIRLGREAEPARAVLFETCRRDAQVLADPAWLEVRFALDDADVRVRRAGLDLDPGWLPWLGCVVRFVYA